MSILILELIELHYMILKKKEQSELAMNLKDLQLKFVLTPSHPLTSF